MSDQAQRRIQAVGQHLSGGGSSSLAPLKKVAAGSSTLRLKGKVAIITGTV